MRAELEEVWEGDQITRDLEQLLLLTFQVSNLRLKTIRTVPYLGLLRF